MVSILPTPIIVFIRNSLSRQWPMKTRKRCGSSCLPSIIISLKSIPYPWNCFITTMSGMPIIPAIANFGSICGKGSRYFSSPIISRLAGAWAWKPASDWIGFNIICMETTVLASCLLASIRMCNTSWIRECSCGHSTLWTPIMVWMSSTGLWFRSIPTWWKRECPNWRNHMTSTPIYIIWGVSTGWVFLPSDNSVTIIIL